METIWAVWVGGELNAVFTEFEQADEHLSEVIDQGGLHDSYITEHKIERPEDWE